MTHDDLHHDALKTHHNSLRRNVTLLQANSVFLSLLFVLPVLIPIYQDRGLGFREFMIGEAFFSAVVIAMEVPSGWLSDVWSRRRTLTLAALIEATGWVLLLCADSFTTTVLAQGFIGIGVSLLSGTNSALLYDSLQELGEETRFRRLEGKRHAYGLYAVAGSALAGGFLYKWHPDLPLYLTILTALLAACLTLLLAEPGRHRVEAHKNPFVDMARAVAYTLNGHREIAGIVILSAVLFAGTKMLMWSQQPYYQLLHIPEELFGVFAAIGFFLGGLGGHFGHLIPDRYRNIPVLLGLLGVTIGFCLTAAFFPGYHAVPLLLAGSLIFGFGMPRVVDAINKRVDGSRRATILSAGSMAVHLVAIPLFVLMGWLDEKASITAALAGLAAIQLLGGAAALLLIRRLNAAQEKPA